MKNIIQALMFGVGLSMDSLAVSISTGMSSNEISKKQILKIAFIFALFTGLMPLIGFSISTGLIKYLQDYDHWIALILLTYVGLEMIVESFKTEEESTFDPFSNKNIILKAIATSIDEIVVGVSFATININILLYVSIVIVITFIFSCLGLRFGSKLNNKFSKHALIFGGVILILIGINIFFEHMNLF